LLGWRRNDFDFKGRWISMVETGSDFLSGDLISASLGDLQLSRFDCLAVF
jgi:hypothetical protein